MAEVTVYTPTGGRYRASAGAYTGAANVAARR